MTDYRIHDDSGVSPVIGVILMVAIVVILSAVIGFYAVELGDTESNVSAGVETDETDSGVQVQWTSEGNAEEVLILVNGSEVSGAKLDTIGDSVVVSADENDNISVVGVGPDGNQSQVQSVTPDSDTTGGSGTAEVVSGGEQAETLGSGFIITVDTTNIGDSPDDEVVIYVGDEYNGSSTYSVSTNGEVENESELTNTTGNTRIQFANPGKYKVHISDGVQHITFNAVPYEEQNKVESIEQWGDVQWQSTEGMFVEAENLTYNATDSPDLSTATSTKRMFYKSPEFSGNESMNEWDTSNIQNMEYMFAGTNFNQDISSWDTSNVVFMRKMFKDADRFNQDISSWDTSNVEGMLGMFEGAYRFKNGGEPLDWDTSKVDDMSYMFAGTSANKHQFNQDISSWDTRNVVDMENMFRHSNFNRDIGGWDTSSLVVAEDMFKEADNFNQDISSWNTSSLKGMPLMFKGADSFNQDIGGWNTSKVNNMQNVFEDADSFNQDISSWDTSEVTRNGMMMAFKDADSFNQDISSWCVSQIDSEPYDFDNNSGIDGEPSKQPNWGDAC